MNFGGESISRSSGALLPFFFNAPVPLGVYFHRGTVKADAFHFYFNLISMGLISMGLIPRSSAAALV
jgi:hypothetical protein